MNIEIITTEVSVFLHLPAVYTIGGRQLRYG